MPRTFSDEEIHWVGGTFFHCSKRSFENTFRERDFRFAKDKPPSPVFVQQPSKSSKRRASATAVTTATTAGTSTAKRARVASGKARAPHPRRGRPPGRRSHTLSRQGREEESRYVVVTSASSGPKEHRSKRVRRRNRQLDDDFINLEYGDEDLIELAYTSADDSYTTERKPHEPEVEDGEAVDADPEEEETRMNCICDSQDGRYWDEM